MILRIFAAVVVLILAAVTGGGWWWLDAMAPQTKGTIQLVGLTAPVTVSRDIDGIPTIGAQTMNDAYFALGFVHAQDRLFQMDLERRLGAGRLAEILGPKLLPSDRQMRTLGLYASAQAALPHLSPSFQSVLASYAAGVNAYIGQARALPLEFTLLRYRPEAWQPADTLVFGKLLALELSGNMRREILRARLGTIFTPAQIQQLLPNYPRDGPVALADAANLYRGLPLDKMLAGMAPLVGPTFASNNWVVDGDHSASGKPLLANDPHLDYSIPGVWYLVRLQAPGLAVTGASIAGAPLIILGHNDRIAWGYTTTNADVEDLYVEKIDPTDANRYLIPHGVEAFGIRHETIKVKGAADVSFIVRSTRHGPVISDAFADTGTVHSATTVLALQATFLGDADSSEEAQWRIDLASDWRSFTEAARLFVAPVQNAVYADTDGNIGLYIPGLIPIRGDGDGRLPVPGWTSRYDWRGYIPFDALPHALNPPEGRIVTANNKIVGPDYPFSIGTDWDLPFRAERIAALLKTTPQQSIVSSTRVMRDTVSLSARRLLPLFLAVPPANDRQRRAEALLAGWDGDMRADKPQPLLFTAWLRALNGRLYGDKLPGDLFQSFGNLNPLFIEGALTRNKAWCDDKLLPAAEACDRQVLAALDEALDGLSKRYGPDFTRWKWGDAHRARFDHPIFSTFPDRIAALFDRDVPADGGNDTVDAGAFHGTAATDPYADRHGPGLRAIYDLSDLDRSVFQMTPGESAYVRSPHYDDLLPMWQDFDWLRLSDTQGGDTLHLLPASGDAPGS